MPFAVHIGATVLLPVWVTVGFLLSGVAVLLALCRVHDRDIPRIGVLTAAFFVASSVHIPLGVASVHLLLNGLVGVVLVSPILNPLGGSTPIRCLTK